MGIQTLPNGLEYFSLAEELENFTTIMYSVLTPFNVAIMIVVTMLLMGMIVFLMLHMARKQVEGAI
jgi:hypothetical protein